MRTDSRSAPQTMDQSHLAVAVTKISTTTEKRTKIMVITRIRVVMETLRATDMRRIAVFVTPTALVATAMIKTKD